MVFARTSVWFLEQLGLVATVFERVRFGWYVFCLRIEIDRHGSWKSWIRLVEFWNNLVLLEFDSKLRILENRIIAYIILRKFGTIEILRLVYNPSVNS